MVEKFEAWKKIDDKDIIKLHSRDIEVLLSQSYWANKRSLAVIEQAIDHSLNYAILDVKTNVIIAFARVVTDYATMYYLCDVIVEQEYRGKGLGKMLVDWVTNEDDRLSGMHGMLLTSDAQGLYSKYGFTENNRCMTKFS